MIDALKLYCDIEELQSDLTEALKHCNGKAPNLPSMKAIVACDSLLSYLSALIALQYGAVDPSKEKNDEEVSETDPVAAHQRTEEVKKGEASMLIENQELYQILENAIKNIHFKIHAIYEPDPNSPFADCYVAAVELFAFGQTYRLYFKTNENNQINVEHLERWYFG